MTYRGRIFGGLATAAALVAAWAVAQHAAACDDSTAARVELGRRLFFDPAIGRRGQVACAACHDPEHGFSDARARSQDETRELPRHSQPLVDLAGEGFHWDGEFGTVRDVIDARVLPGALPARAAADRALKRLQAMTSAGATPDASAVATLTRSLDSGGTYGDDVRVVLAQSGVSDEDVEFVDPDRDEQVANLPATRVSMPLRRGRAADTIADRISRGGRYDVGFVAAFGEAAVTPQRVGDALEAYLGSLKSSTNAVDRRLAGDKTALSASADRGLELFRGKANCSQCHVVEGTQPLFSDGKFHNTGVASAPVPIQTNRRASSADESDAGRVAATFVGADRGAFKTPSLRDVARRAPYFHDASRATLADVVRYYDKGGTPNGHLDAKIKPLSLSDAEIADLVAFLESLTGDVRPGLAPKSPLRAPRITVRVENLDGTPVAGCAVVVRPFGDRLAGTTAMPAPVTATTDADGRAVVDMPESTHVVVETAAAGASAPLPDWTTATTFVVTPKNRVALRVRFADGVDEHPTQFFAYAGGVLAPGAPAKFTKVRDLGTSEALYEATPPARLTGKAVCALCPQNGKGVRGGDFAVDFALGATNVVDLRPTIDRPSDDAARVALAKDVEAIRAFAPVGGVK
jgi:cytochrome c peroxidase